MDDVQREQSQQFARANCHLCIFISLPDSLAAVVWVSPQARARGKGFVQEVYLGRVPREQPGGQAREAGQEEATAVSLWASACLNSWGCSPEPRRGSHQAPPATGVGRIAGQGAGLWSRPGGARGCSPSQHCCRGCWDSPCQTGRRGVRPRAFTVVPGGVLRQIRQLSPASSSCRPHRPRGHWDR